MIQLEQLETPELERLLRRLGEKYIPVATKHAVNKTAWEARRLSQEAIERKMTLRNKWTQGSIRVKPTKTFEIRRMEARVGSTQEYMRRQEEGHTEVASGKHGVAIPTGYSAGQEGQKPRTKRPTPANRMRNINLTRGSVRGRTRRQRVILPVQTAVTTGKRYVFLDFGPGKRKGVFKVLGGKKEGTKGWPESGWPENARIKMVQDLSHRSVVIRPRPWLDPSVREAMQKMPQYYRDALIFMIKKKSR